MTLDLTDYIEDIGEIENEYRKLSREVHRELKDMGIVPAPQPLDEDGTPIRPVIPAGIGDMHFSELSILLSEFAAYSSYVKYQLADIRNEAVIAQRAMRDVKAHLRSQMKGNATDKSDKMVLDKRYREADLREYKATAKKELAAAVDEGVERSFFSISRAITSRGHEREQSDRDRRVGDSGRRVDPLRQALRRGRGKKAK